MKKNSRISYLNVKIFLCTLHLKEDKSYSLAVSENDQQKVFIFKDEDSLCNFLIDKNIDTSSPRIEDIIKHDLIIKRFEDGTVICSKYLCQYLSQKAQEKVDLVQKKKNRPKLKTSNKH